MSTSAATEMIKVDRQGKVAVVTLYRPEALNALCNQLCDELVGAFQELDGDSSVGAIVLTGHGKAFAAGADIKEMQPNTLMDVYQKRLFDSLDFGVRSIRKPILAAVNGFALGGGCELAMMCDVVYASEKAKFGQPEIKLGTIPGIGGSQRLSRAVGKSLSMHLNLTGEMIGAEEALRAGLVAKVFPPDQLLEEVVKYANQIANYSKPIVALVKEAVNASQELSLSEGLLHERRLFYSTFGTEDRKEGMSAFVEKRDPKFQDK